MTHKIQCKMYFQHFSVHWRKNERNPLIRSKAMGILKSGQSYGGWPKLWHYTIYTTGSERIFSKFLRERGFKAVAIVRAPCHNFGHCSDSVGLAIICFQTTW